MTPTIPDALVERVAVVIAKADEDKGYDYTIAGNNPIVSDWSIHLAQAALLTLWPTMQEMARALESARDETGGSMEQQAEVILDAKQALASFHRLCGEDAE